jgi:succinate dehydrogenase / fumarate reductase cytochrome b subunit
MLLIRGHRFCSFFVPVGSDRFPCRIFDLENLDTKANQTPMLRWIGNALASSVGKKIVLGLTGFLLLGFVVEHLLGNLKLIEGGEVFNEYVAFLQSFGPLLVVSEIGLVALFACHIFLALRLTMENRKARTQRYEVRNNRGAQTFGSVSMFYTGALLLGFGVVHMLDFRLAEGFTELEDPASVVYETLSRPGKALFYIAAVAVLGVHLSHGFRSAFQSLGLSHPKLDAVLGKASIGLGALIALGFASIPVYIMMTKGS